MTLSQIQRDAMAQAQQGRWALADAIEIEARTDNQGNCAGGYLQGGRLRLIAWLDEERSYCQHCEGEGTESCEFCDKGKIDCPDCEGDGECRDCGPDSQNQTLRVECTTCKGSGNCDRCAGDQRVTCKECEGVATVDCSECEGSGRGSFSHDQLIRVEDLNGRAVWREQDGDDQPDFGKFVDRTWAQLGIAQYRSDLARAAAEKSKAAQAACTRRPRPASGQTTLIDTTAHRESA